MFFNSRFIGRTARKLNENFVRPYSVPKVKRLGSEIALNYFDQIYIPLFKNWASIRLGLLCPHSYCAVVNVFAKPNPVSSLFEGMDVYNIKDVYYLNMRDDEASSNETSEKTADTTDDEEKYCDKLTSDESNMGSDDMLNTDEHEYVPATKFKYRDLDAEEDYTGFFDPNIKYTAQLVKHGTIHLPESWDIFFSPRGTFKKFPPPTTNITGLLNYYLMDGASILPVLALDVRKNEEVGDLCASPGGKSLAILFGMQFGKLVCNDVSLSRLNKLKTVLDSYLPGTENWSKRILISNLDVCEWTCFESFDKILLDVPCTNDRLSVTRDGNNIFQPKRYDERMRIPQIQTAMLCAGLKALKPGGSLVYSTCSLSPLQNDGVVHIALSKLSTECSFQYIINDLTDSFFPLRNMFQFSDTCRYGQLVVPFLPLNYGPMYISKISRVK